MNSATLTDDLREQFEQECRRSAPTFLAEQQKEQCRVDALERVASTLGRMAEDLSRLIADGENLSVEQLEPAIRRIIEQRGYLAECGDLRNADDYRRRVDLYVSIVARVVKRMRSQSRLGGEWSDAPVTPLMFG